MSLLFVVAGACGAAAVTGFQDADRNRRAFETGRRAPAKVVAARISERRNFTYKVVVKSYDHFLTLELQGATPPRQEFGVEENDYRLHPIGTMTTVVVDGGRFLPEFLKASLVGGGKAWVQTAVALVSGAGFLLLLAGTLLRRRSATSPGTRCL